MMIPNMEVKSVYDRSISTWFDRKMERTDRSPLMEALERGDCEAAEDFINDQLMDTISYYDYAESYYHGFLAGLLTRAGRYRVKSNRESGTGSYTQRQGDDYRIQSGRQRTAAGGES